MSIYCSICGNELAPEEEEEGICLSCKIAKGENVSADEVEPDVR